MAYALLKGDEEYNRLLGEAVSELKQRIRKCVECGNYTEDEICSICSSPDRDSAQLCVVEESQDVMMIESTGEFRGLYHVLHGVLSPLDGMGPRELGFDRLIERIDRLDVKELILATNPTMEGDSTALYIKQLLEEGKLKVSRIATGSACGRRYGVCRQDEYIPGP